MPELDDLLLRQSGVVSRGQLEGLEVPRRTRDTMLRRRQLVAMLPGVYVNHTGSVTREQRVIAATLYAGRSALHLDTALDHPSSSGLIHLAIDVSRRVLPQPGVRIHRVGDLEDKVRWNLTPPRVRPEHAALELAHRASTDLDAIAALTRVIGSRQTQASRLGEALADRSRIRRRALLVGLVDDLAAGTHSVLEHGYLSRVLRPHELPEPSELQAPRTGTGRREYRDAVHAELATVVELDSRWHDNDSAAARDADRDLDDLAAGEVTVRLRYHQVFGTPCRTAHRLAAVFRRRGWDGTPRPCSSDCAIDVGEHGESDGSGPSDVPQ